MARCAKHARSLSVTQLVTIYATARGVVNEIRTLAVVNREVDIRVFALDTHERSALDATMSGWQLRAVRRRDQRRIKVVIQIDDCERRAAIGFAADNQLAVMHRRRARAAGKAKVNYAFLGNTRSGIRIA